MVLLVAASFLFSAEKFYWGGVSKIDITQEQIDKVIKEYVDTNMPKEVEAYNTLLEKQKQQELSKYADKTFVHKTLMWQDMSINQDKKMNIVESKVYCRDLILADRKDWRVPTYYELMELIDYTKNEPSSIEGLKYLASDLYWSDSKEVDTEHKYWTVDFKEGITDTDDELKRHFMRCVRTMSTKKGEY